MNIVSNCHPTWTHYTDSEPTSLSPNAAYLTEKQKIPIL